jgi:hypothetical protein
MHGFVASVCLDRVASVNSGIGVDFGEAKMCNVWQRATFTHGRPRGFIRTTCTLLPSFYDPPQMQKQADAEAGAGSGSMPALASPAAGALPSSSDSSSSTTAVSAEGGPSGGGGGAGDVGQSNGATAAVSVRSVAVRDSVGLDVLHESLFTYNSTNPLPAHAGECGAACLLICSDLLICLQPAS